MASKLEQFLQGFDGQDELGQEVREGAAQPATAPVGASKDEEVLTQLVNNEVEIKPVHAVVAGKNGPKQLLQSDILQDDDLNDVVDQGQIVEIEKPKKTLKLRLNRKNEAVKKEPVEEKKKLQPEVKHELLQNKEHVVEQHEVCQDEVDEQLFLKSGTLLERKQDWLAVMRKARDAKGVTGQFHDKVAAGRFRFTKTGDLEILPNLDTYGKSSKEIIHMSWLSLQEKG